MKRLSCELTTYVNKMRKNFCRSIYKSSLFYKVSFVYYFYWKQRIIKLARINTIIR